MTQAAEVADRLVARRARLQPFCAVEPVRHHLRLQSYFQLARQLYRQSEVYFAQRAWDNAYVFLAKFIKLCSKEIPAHRDYELPPYKKEREWVRAQAKDGFTLFDAILDGMEHEELELLEYELEVERDSDEQQPQPSVVSLAAPSATASMTLEQRLEALRLRQRAASESASARFSDGGSFAQAQSQALTTRQELDKASKSSVRYPSVGKPSWITASEKPSSVDAVTLRRPPPASRQRSIEAIDRLASGKIRTLEIPTSLIAEFIALAEPNTRQEPYGIETCGILAGELRGSNLVITTLVIPKQQDDARVQGSSDMCYMTNEEELFDYCFGHDLLTLGWIHTHPRQTCFLSSVDIHTQCGFQSILPEAIAIVVAPTDRQRNVGVFRLTEPNGLQLIQNCNLTGFHEHPSNVQIYSDALDCDWGRHAPTALVDMR
ncbi:hypothetical protein PybrP1_000071 [[Pythium] brassicae (nom. inval.)]|nr:hypothetical protein PybrP1_000071 [[Pythium] brassicae (nom. inval.)]